jgi:histidinol-phosphate phosphatase family protein
MLKWKIDNSWTLFLDRDGVINERLENDYVKSPDEFQFIAGSDHAIASLSNIFGWLFVVTNQQGIGKGLMTEGNLREIHRLMEQNVEDKGGKITKVYYAPGMASPDNYMRKPKPGMALLAQRQHKGVDFVKSIMVGDTDSDIIFGSKLGMKTVRIFSEIEEVKVEADITIGSLKELYNYLEV